MDTVNIILLIAGAIVILLGVLAFFYPNLARWINAPGGPRLKSIIALIVGIVLIIIGLLYKN